MKMRRQNLYWTPTRAACGKKYTYNHDEEEVEDEKVKNLERTSTMVAVGRSVAVMSSSWERLSN